MTDADAAHAAAADSHDDHASGHGPESTGEPLGPIDVIAWGYTVAGAAVGVLVALALYAAGGA